MHRTSTTVLADIHTYNAGRERHARFSSTQAVLISEDEDTVYQVPGGISYSPPFHALPRHIGSAIYVGFIGYPGKPISVAQS